MIELLASEHIKINEKKNLILKSLDKENFKFLKDFKNSYFLVSECYINKFYKIKFIFYENEIKPIGFLIYENYIIKTFLINETSFSIEKTIREEIEKKFKIKLNKKNEIKYKKNSIKENINIKFNFYGFS